MTRIVKCTCKHQYQDSLYGIGNRVANEFKTKLSGRGYRCTVCLKEYNVGGEGAVDK